MSKKINGYAKWILVALAILVIAFNSGVTYNHIHNLSTAMKKLTLTVENLDVKIDEINIKLAERRNQ